MQTVTPITSTNMMQYKSRTKGHSVHPDVTTWDPSIGEKLKYKVVKPNTTAQKLRKETGHQQEKNNPAGRRGVHFDSDVKVVETISLSEMTPEERANAFYSDDESRIMLEDAFSAVAKAQDYMANDRLLKSNIVSSSSSSSSSSSTTTTTRKPRESVRPCIRGLEDATKHGRASMEIRVAAAVTAVLDEQERMMRCEGSVDPLQLANVCKRVTRKSRREAIEQGKVDESQARTDNQKPKYMSEQETHKQTEQQKIPKKKGKRQRLSALRCFKRRR
mmetsp:Transcript_9551/g.21912  ORF Transcript_9551/g.21912 Transcript_9551/m.21912 type:complete len:275 (+) Transcript_9551:2-826(+)